MKITEKINMDIHGLFKNGPITIVAFGDSVTHGAFADGVIDYESVYWHRLSKKINQRRNYIPVNVINAGIAFFLYKPIVTIFRSTNLLEKSESKSKINVGLIILSLFVILTMILILRIQVKMMR